MGIWQFYWTEWMVVINDYDEESTNEFFWNKDNGNSERWNKIFYKVSVKTKIKKNTSKTLEDVESKLKSKEEEKDERIMVKEDMTLKRLQFYISGRIFEDGKKRILLRSKVF